MDEWQQRPGSTPFLVTAKKEPSSLTLTEKKRERKMEKKIEIIIRVSTFYLLSLLDEEFSWRCLLSQLQLFVRINEQSGCETFLAC